MKVIVLGGGVIGLSTAYALVRSGHEVTVVDREPTVGTGSSFANGAQLSYSYVAPLAGPGVLASLPRWLLDRDAPLRFRPRLDWHQWQWCLAFLLACNRRASRQTTIYLLALAGESRVALQRLMETEALDFRFRRSGKLTVHSDSNSFARARAQAEFQERFGERLEVLDAEACLALEPTLVSIRQRIVGGIYSAKDETGDCFEFCQQIATLLAEKYEVTFLLSTEIRRLVASHGHVSHALSDKGDITGDVFVVTLGAGSRSVLRPLAIALPILSLKGYSVTIPVTAPEAAPSVSVTDHANRVVFASLGNELRVAGMVDIGTGTTVDNERVETLRRQALEVFPQAGDIDAARAWSGVRPATPQGSPIIKRCDGIDNLVLNVGHGALGFTLAMGAGEIVARCLATPA